MKKLSVFALVIAFAFMAVPFAHADTIIATNTDPNQITFKAGYFPQEVLTGVTIAEIFNAIKKENPTCDGRSFVINQIAYDFTH